MATLDQTIKEIINAYNFSEEEVIPIIESILRYTLMEYLKKDVDVFFKRNGVEAYLYRDGLSGTYPEKVDFSRFSSRFYRSLYNNLRYYLELKKKAAEFEIVRVLQGKLVGGYVLEKFSDKYTIKLVEHPFEDLEAVFERLYWMPKETLLMGEHYFFVCKNVRIVADTMPRLIMYLSRTSIKLPSLMIEKAFYDKERLKTRCDCIKRVVGKFSIVRCKTKIPRDIVSWVSLNLNNEKVIVTRW